jgi:PAS domain S-box-containing protein
MIEKMEFAVALCEIVTGQDGEPIDLIYRDVNPAFEEKLGLSKQDVVDGNATELFPKLKSDPANWIKKYGEAALKDKEFSFDEYSQDMEKWYHVSVFSLRKPFFVIMFEDIDERKKADKKIENLAKFPSENPNPVLRVDKNGYLIYCNEAAKELLKAFDCGVAGVIPEEWRTFVDEAFCSGERRYFEEQIGELTFAFTASPLTEYVNVYGYDITELKKAEKALQDIERDLNRAQVVGKIGSWRLDTRRDVLMWSDENYRIFGVSKGTPMTYEGFLGIVHPEDRVYVDREWNTGLRGEPYDIEHRIIVEGEVRWVRERAELEFDTEGKLKGGFGTTQDITDLMDMRHRLEDSSAKLQEYTTNLEQLAEERANKLRDSERLAAIGATAGMVGHDIRNPLQSIMGDLYLLKSDVSMLPESEEKDSMKESIASIKKSVEYIDKIVQDLQDFAKPLEPKLGETDLEELCEDVMFKRGYRGNVEVSFQVESGAKTLIADASFLRRILSNLVKNAVQAMPKGGKLAVHAYREGKDVVIVVQDTGAGISEENKAKLFTPLFTTKSKGQGFGLPVVKRMAEALGGTVNFESAEGKGTKFIVCLPHRKK